MADSIIEHLIISIAGFALGCSLGGFLIVALKRLIVRWSLDIPRSIILIPWRSIILGILLFIHVPYYGLVKVGIGPELGIISIAIYYFFFALILFAEILKEIDSKDMKIRIVKLTRTLAVFSILLTYNYGPFGGGGLGLLTVESIRIFDYRTAWMSWIWMIVLGLLLDLIMGTFQLFLETRDHSLSEDQNSAT
jgi:ABC-type phosphate/phosphonate transport system permease subunit